MLLKHADIRFLKSVNDLRNLQNDIQQKYERCQTKKTITFTWIEKEFLWSKISLLILSNMCMSRKKARLTDKTKQQGERGYQKQTQASLLPWHWQISHSEKRSHFPRNPYYILLIQINKTWELMFLWKLKWMVISKPLKGK